MKCSRAEGDGATTLVELSRQKSKHELLEQLEPTFGVVGEVDDKRL